MFPWESMATWSDPIINALECDLATSFAFSFAKRCTNSSALSFARGLSSISGLCALKGMPSFFSNDCRKGEEEARIKEGVLLFIK